MTYGHNWSKKKSSGASGGATANQRVGGGTTHTARVQYKYASRRSAVSQLPDSTRPENWSMLTKKKNESIISFIMYLLKEKMYVTYNLRCRGKSLGCILLSP